MVETAEEREHWLTAQKKRGISRRGTYIPSLWIVAHLESDEEKKRVIIEADNKDGCNVSHIPLFVKMYLKSRK